MQEYLLEPPYFLFGHQVTADWQKTSVLTAKRIYRQLTERQLKARSIPAIDGDSKPQWMKDVANKIVVVKTDIAREINGKISHSVATEFISAAIAQLLRL